MRDIISSLDCFLTHISPFIIIFVLSSETVVGYGIRSDKKCRYYCSILESSDDPYIWKLIISIGHSRSAGIKDEFKSSVETIAQHVPRPRSFVVIYLP